MMLVITIRRASDGVERTYSDDSPWDAGSEFMWSDGGNYGCDCNRALFFCRAAGEDDIDIDCGDSAYRVRICDENGNELFRDEDW